MPGHRTCLPSFPLDPGTATATGQHSPKAPRPRGRLKHSQVTPADPEKQVHWALTNTGPLESGAESRRSSSSSPRTMSPSSRNGSGMAKGLLPPLACTAGGRALSSTGSGKTEARGTMATEASSLPPRCGKPGAGTGPAGRASCLGVNKSGNEEGNGGDREREERTESRKKLQRAGATARQGGRRVQAPARVGHRANVCPGRRRGRWGGHTWLDIFHRRVQGLEVKQMTGQRMPGARQSHPKTLGSSLLPFTLCLSPRLQGRS